MTFSPQARPPARVKTQLDLVKTIHEAAVSLPKNIPKTSPTDVVKA